jgi:hypothetical protein
MADRNVHYEAAFEAFLRHRGVPYVAVDEAKKALFATAKLKSFDFVVYSKTGPNLLIDVKGRLLRDRAAKRGFETWATERDVADLAQWEAGLRRGVQGGVLFRLLDRAAAHARAGMFEYRNRWYLLMGIDLAEYRGAMRRRSAKWETVSLPASSSGSWRGRWRAGFSPKPPKPRPDALTPFTFRLPVPRL